MDKSFLVQRARKSWSGNVHVICFRPVPSMSAHCLKSCCPFTVTPYAAFSKAQIQQAQQCQHPDKSYATQLLAWAGCDMQTQQQPHLYLCTCLSAKPQNIQLPPNQRRPWHCLCAVLQWLCSQMFTCTTKARDHLQKHLKMPHTARKHHHQMCQLSIS